LERPAGKPRQDHGLTGAQILQYSQYLDLEFFDLTAAKHCLSNTMLPSSHLGKGEYRGLRKKIRCYNQKGKDSKDGHKPILVPSANVL
jgi:hypothetical protein